MAKGIFQKMYDRIDQARTPKWLKGLLKIVGGLLRVGFKVLSEDATSYLKTEIIAQAGKDIPGTEKLQNVIDGFRTRYTMSTITNSMLTTIICSLVEMFKERGAIS